MREPLPLCSLAAVLVLSLSRRQDQLEGRCNCSLLGPPAHPGGLIHLVWGGAGEGASLNFQVTLLLPPLVWGPHFENDWAAGKLTDELVGAGAVFESRAFMWLENA